jgi:hypothetical protein
VFGLVPAGRARSLDPELGEAIAHYGRIFKTLRILTYAVEELLVGAAFVGYGRRRRRNRDRWFEAPSGRTA